MRSTGHGPTPRSFFTSAQCCPLWPASTNWPSVRPGAKAVHWEFPVTGRPERPHGEQEAKAGYPNPGSRRRGILMALPPVTPAVTAGLNTITSPADVRALAPVDLPLLTADIRAFVVDCVCAASRHPSPNLGVVERTLALHRVFDSPRDALVSDTGHLAYVHKIVTGRQKDFDVLRQAGGLSGYPSPQ